MLYLYGIARSPQRRDRGLSVSLNCEAFAFDVEHLGGRLTRSFQPVQEILGLLFGKAFTPRWFGWASFSLVGLGDGRLRSLYPLRLRSVEIRRQKTLVETERDPCHCRRSSPFWAQKL
jgi:hypothetical protein